MFVIDVPYFNLDQIYNSGQVPRWIKLTDSNYVIIHKDKAVKAKQIKERLIMNCSTDEFFDIWFDYLDLRTDYMRENNHVRKIGNKFKIIANRGSGVHIIKQDPFEAYIYSKIIEFYGYSKAGKAINHIAEVCGTQHIQSMREAGRITWYEFPTPEMILENLNKLKRMGNVNEWLEIICTAIINEGFDLLPKISKCKLFRLFGLHEINTFPITGIEDTLIKNFGENPEEFADWYLCDSENKGLIYLYILHHITNPPKEITYYYGIN